MKSVESCDRRALSVESRRLSSSDDLLRPRLASASRLRVDIFSMMGRRRWRKMLRLAFVGYGINLVYSVFHCKPHDFELRDDWSEVVLVVREDEMWIETRIKTHDDARQISLVKAVEALGYNSSIVSVRPTFAAGRSRSW
jgi:hypothetical protein